MRRYFSLCCFFVITGSLSAQQFSNKGKEFWVGYGYNWLFFNDGSGTGAPINSQEMVLYLSADQAASVTVTIPGTAYTRTYSVPANTAIKTELIPKAGSNDCRIINEGLYRKSVHIESTVPIVVFEHTYGLHSSGATMLIPVEAYGYTYFSHNSRQPSGGWNSWFYVLASENNTTVRITPKLKSIGGRAARQPFTVNLDKGEIYNIIGGTGANEDMSGSKIQSIPGADGKCHPIAVFSGTSRTTLGLDDSQIGAGGSDFMMVQAYPVSAWGLEYLTAPSSSALDPSKLKMNTFRVYVSDPNANVYRNGIILPTLLQSSYYDFKSTTADYITSDMPIMVSQITHSQDALPADAGELGDPEMFFLSPVEQAINNVIFYNNNTESILINYLTLIIPETGMASLKIDGTNSYDYSYPHPNRAGYRVVVKQLPVTPMQHTLSSDAGFTAITYGLGSYESYGYNAGAYMNNLKAFPEIKPVNSNATYNYVCTKTPFLFSVKTIYKAKSITLHFSQVANITPATDVVINDPVPSGTSVINGKTYYAYDLKDEYAFSVAGEYSLPVSITDPSIDNCSQSEIIRIPIPVHQGPSTDFSAVTSCVSDSAKFTWLPISPDAKLVKWSFGEGTTSVIEKPAVKYKNAGTYNVKLEITRDLDGCRGDTVKTVTIRSFPKVEFTLPTLICMPGQATFRNTTTIPQGSASTPSYEWKFGDGGISADVNPAHSYGAASAYKVQLKLDFDGCKDSITADLPVTAFVTTPEPGFKMSDTAFCANAAALFYDNSTPVPGAGTSWKWDFDNGQTSTDKNPGAKFREARGYNVKLTLNTKGCISATKEQTVNVYAPPAVDAGAGQLIAKGDAITLNGVITGDFTSVKWTPSASLSNDAVTSPVAAPLANQLYYLTATGKAGCQGYDSVLIKVFTEIKVPNAFSPNNDGINDKWNIPGLINYANAEIEIFNRWGQIVYKSRGYNNPWDGTIKGNMLPVGAYYYVIKLNEKGFDVLKGSVLIIR